METFKNNLRTITQYLSNLRIVLKIQGRLVTLYRAVIQAILVKAHALMPMPHVLKIKTKNIVISIPTCHAMSEHEDQRKGAIKLTNSYRQILVDLIEPLRDIISGYAGLISMGFKHE